MIAVVGDAETQRKALRAFQPLGKCGCLLPDLEPGHLDGWGVTAYRKGETAYAARSSGSIEEEKAAYFRAVDDVVTWQSPVVIAHTRKASRGAVNIENVHPFCDPPWMLCHNGTVDGLEVLGPKPAMAGTSDTEDLFRRWLAGKERSTQSFSAWLDTVGRVGRYSALCCLLTDGRELLASRRIGSTFFRPIDTPQTYAAYYTLSEWRQGENRVLCSEQLPDLGGTWRLMADGEDLIVPV